MSKKKEKKFLIKKPIILVLMGIFLLFLLLFIFWSFKYKNFVYPGVYIGDKLISGKSAEELTDYINKESYKISDDGLVFVSESGKEVDKKRGDIYDVGLSQSFISFFPTESAKLAFDKSSNKNFLGFLAHLLNFGKRQNVVILFEIDEVGLEYFIKENFPELIIAAEDAYFYVEDADDIESSDYLKIKKEKIGIDINYEKIYNDLYKNLRMLKNTPIVINTVSSYPALNTNNLNLLKEEANYIMQTNKNLSLSFLDNKGKQKSWNISPGDLISWVDINEKSNENKISLGLNKIEAYLENNISILAEKEIILPKFEMKENRVSGWELGRDGQELNVSESAKKIQNSFAKGLTEIELVVDVLSVDAFVSENDFKIREVVGTGVSNFQGSSVNRIHNIKVGANSLHGLLIAPDEEFSILKALGDIDAETGYRPELVIKDGKTIPEFGGGLCQVSTTLFRTALQTGLPITMRRNHSYRVSYYEPAGTDATIYNPWPDFKFINDTGNYILIQSRFNGNNIYFDFWGLSDNRLVEVGEPVIYNIVKPPSTKYIESDELAPGEEKCTERSHNGADAYFDYKVTYINEDGEPDVVEKRFRSHYVPWQAVCLVGKKVEEEKVEEVVIEEGIVSEVEVVVPVVE